LAVLASFQTLNGQTQKVLLGFTVFSDESSYMASDYKAIIKKVLGTFMSGTEVPALSFSLIQNSKTKYKINKRFI
jgi:hypothetical protein